MDKLDELIISFINICCALKNVHFIGMDKKSQYIELRDHIPAIRVFINSHLDNLEKELKEKIEE